MFGFSNVVIMAVDQGSYVRLSTCLHMVEYWPMVLSPKSSEANYIIYVVGQLKGACS
jgi:hypothetical protein